MSFFRDLIEGGKDFILGQSQGPVKTARPYSRGSLDLLGSIANPQPKQNVNFGMPTNQKIPQQNIGNTQTSTRSSLIAPSPITAGPKMVEPQPVVKPTTQEVLARPAMISAPSTGFSENDRSIQAILARQELERSQRFQGVKDMLPEPLRDGLFGNPTDQRFDRNQKGLTGFLYGGLTKTDNDKFLDRAERLESLGVESNRALELAWNDVKGIDNENLSSDEKRILRNAGLREFGESALDSLDFIPAGTVAKNTIEQSVKRLLNISDTSVVQRELTQNLRLTPQQAASVSQDIAATTDGVEINKIIQQAINSNKTQTAAPRKLTDIITSSRKEKVTVVDDKFVDTIPKTASGDIDAFKYAEAQDAARESSRGGKTIADNLQGFSDLLFDKMVDYTGPIQRAYKQGLKTDADFALGEVDKVNVDDYIDRVLNAPSITTGFLKEKGFNDVVQTIGNDNLKYFDQYLIARRAQDLRGRGIETGRDTEKLIQADEAIIRQMGGKFEEQAVKIDSFVEARLNYMVDAGLLSKEQVTNLRSTDPRYVPFQRTFSEDELMAEGGTFNRKGIASNSESGIQKMTGSRRHIESPLESLLESTESMVVRAEKNKAARTIASYAEIKGNPFGLREIKSTNDKTRGMGTITFMDNGKKRIFEVNADIEKAAKALDVQRLNIIGQAAAAPVRIARVGITGVSPGFTLKNVARDQVSAFVLSNNGLKASIANPTVWGAGIAQAVKHGELYDEMIAQGALMTSVDYSRNALKPTLKQIAQSNTKFNSVVYNAKRPQNYFREIENLISRSEEATRIQQYKAGYDAAISRGVDPETAKILASREARENSVNFARRGEWGTVMNNMFLYLNAGIQGSRRLVRGLKDKPKETGLKIAITFTTPVMAFSYWNMSDPERKKVYDDLQDWEKDTNIIIIPPNPTKDENGRWSVIKIPLQPGMAEFANAPRRAMEDAYGLDEFSFGEAASRMLRVVQPVDASNPMNTAVVQAIKPSIEVATNQSTFTGNPIVPRNLEGLNPEEQYFSKAEGDAKNTSGTAKLIADNLGVSPIKTEHFINATFGTVARNVLNTSDKALAATGAIDPDQIGGEEVGYSVAKGFTSAAGGKKEGEVLNEIYEETRASRSASESMRDDAFRKYQDMKEMLPADANNEINQIRKENPELFEKILDVAEAEKKDFTREEKAIRSASVGDGTRAKLIMRRAGEIRDEQGNAAANAYVSDLQKKGILSKEVIRQLKEMQQGDTI
jgi:hypothetical protein